MEKALDSHPATNRCPVNHPQEKSDEEMAAALRAGDESVLADILRTKGGMVEQALRGRFPMLDAADLDDVLSTALLRLWTRRSRYDPNRSAIGTWFYVIARNVAVDFLRAEHGEKTATTASPESTSTKEPRWSKAAYDAVCEILAGLEEVDRQIVLAYVHWGPQPEFDQTLSRELGTTPGNIRTKRSRLMKRIRNELAARGFAANADASTGEST
jgi:RNA polymerase sigma factor (sigma-70 family)